MTLLTLLLVATAAYAQGPVREEQTIEVNGAREVWRLQWKSPPKPACYPGDPSWYTCPCAGFSFGESGALDLVRLRQGVEVERLALKPFFEGDAVVQKWPTGDNDMEEPESPALPKAVARRPVVRLMNFGDYDHNGKATEFYIQTSAGPCGHTRGVVVGVSSSNSRLHAFGTALHPDKPLLLQKVEWNAFLKAGGSAHLVDWPCGDHGENKQFELEMQGTPHGIEVVRETYACPRAANARPMKKEEQ